MASFLNFVNTASSVLSDVLGALGAIVMDARLHWLGNR